MPRKAPGPPCVVCKKPSVARKLCATHYKRFARHGHLEVTRPEDWGRREKHPLYGVWHWTRRGPYDPKWKDFWSFIADVGERPTEDHFLRKRDAERPAGPGNFYWAEKVATVTETDRASYAAYQREWRRQNPLRAKNSELSRYGITIAEYEGMLTSQNGGCAICGQVDEWFSLAVDHCHGTNRVRGLLCSQCNRGIGLFRDKPELLEKAAEYLRFPQRLV